MRKTVAAIEPGDILICYVAEISRWIGTLEVTEGHFVDDSPIWSGDRAYTERVKVTPILQLALETAVPAVSLRDDMPMFQSLANPNKWSIFFRRSPSEMSEEDANVVIEALQEAERDPVVRPIPRSKSPKLSATSPPEARPSDDGSGSLSHDLETATAAHSAPPVDTEEPISSATQGVDPSAPGDQSLGSEHTEIQWRLLALGAAMGLSVWAPKNDRGRTWSGHSPSDVKGLVDDLPAQFGREAMRTISNIDVLWLRRETFVAAFEIENSTSIYSGLLRMSDLLALVPNLAVPLFLVAPDERREKVFREVNRPTFARRDTPLKDVCQFIPYSSIRSGYGSVKEYARFMKPTVIEQWAEVCEIDVEP